MYRLLSTLAIAALLFVVHATAADAKTPNYVISGGELGEYAARFWDTREDGPFTQSLERIEPPALRPSLAYDLYTSFGNFAVPSQMAQGQPEARYYPDAGLLEYPSLNIWYRVAPHDVEFLDGVVADALESMRRGELEVGPVAADFRARSLDRVTYWLRPMSAISLDDRYFASQPSSCEGLDGCFTITRSGERFIMGDLIETLDNPQRPPDAVEPAYIIEYYGIVEPPHGGIGGALGFYSPPAGGEPGRFWYDGYFYDQASPYHETTPGFDAALARALDPAGTDGGNATTTLAGVAAALGLVLAGAGVARGVARRRR
ncbi:MAG: hypothetical protein WD939_06520 [Dehalococcoidia bacterium]